MGPYRTRCIVFSSGERVPMLLGSSSGLPHWHATLFLTTQLRNNSKAPNTLAAVLAALRILLDWADAHSIDLEARFARRLWLLDPEVESLTAFVRRSRITVRADTSPEVQPSVRMAKRQESARAALGSEADRVTGATEYTRLTYIAKYLEWLAVQILCRDARQVDGGTRSDIKAMATSVCMRRPRKRARSRLSARRGLSEESQQRLRQLTSPDAVDSPFTGLVRRRNALIVNLLDGLGIRVGELLALKVKDFDFQRNEVVISRRHGDPHDPRANQPVVKTLDRRIPLAPDLSAAVSRYVMEERRKFPRARKHEFLLVTHQPGPHQGMPISQPSLGKLFAQIRRVAPDALAGLTPHVLRHTLNDRLSSMWDADGVKSAEEEKMRSYLMGWREGSGTAESYTRRHTETGAQAASLKLQKRPRKG